MDTSGRNRALAAAVKKHGANEVAARLGIGGALLHLYVIGEFPVPDAVWMLVLNVYSELVDDSNPLASQSRPNPKHGR